MDVSLKPEMQRFIDEQVRAGRFTSTAEALEAGVARLMLDPDPAADGEDVAELRRSLQQMRNGETVDAGELHARLRRKHLGQ